jgi:hypothetical protein
VFNLSKKRATDEISKMLDISESDSNGGTITKEWIIEMLHQLPIHVDSPDSMDKQSLMQVIMSELGLEWDQSCLSTGSTLTSIAFERISSWVFENIETPRLTLELKDEVIQSIKNLYDELPQNFSVTQEWFFEESFFDKFGLNWTWLKSLEPIWRVLNPTNFDINWNGDGEQIKSDVCIDLGFNMEQSQLDLIAQINSHLSVAFNHVIAYNEFVDVDEISVSKAMEQWNELWDVSEDEREIIEPIIAKTDNWTIGTFANKATKNELDTDPIYQREFVWSNPACQMLINSILMGIPLPSVILHETVTDGRQKYQIIDGKQRITSLLRFIGSLPKARTFMKSKIPILKSSEGKELLAGADTEYLIDVILSNKDPVNTSEKTLPRFRKWHRNKKFGLISDEDKLAKKQILPFPLRKNEFQDVPALEVLNGLYYHEMRNIEIDILGSKVRVSEIFEESSTAYKIPVIIYDKDTKPGQIRRVFNRYNTQGTKLNATEVNNAAYQDLPAMRLTLAMSRIKPERGEELIPGYNENIKNQSKIVEDFFTACNLSSKRFEWAKLMSVILGLLYTEVPKKSNGKFSYLSTAKLIKTFFENQTDESTITMSNCNDLANVIGSATSSLHSELLFDLFLDNPDFSSKSGNDKWGQPAAIAVMVGAILCHSSGKNIAEIVEEDDLIYEKMDAFLQTQKAMGQTQSDVQWNYYANVVTTFCSIFDINKDNFSDKYNLYGGYNLLQYFHELIQ